ncbi:MAG: PH domain-containing protein, partial [Acidimicrobiales bacterium]
PAVPVELVPLFTVDPARLVGSILISGPALVVYMIVGALVAAAVAAPSAAGGAVAGSTSTLLAFGAAMWTRFNGEYRLSLGTDPDGLHVRSGLIQTSAETIPWGRIQALRVIEPIFWRPFHWARVEADVAGRNVSGRQNRAARRAGKALIPVGTVEEAHWLVHLVMPDAPTTLVPPPSRAKWKAPFRFRNLSFAANRNYVVTTSGRLRRVTDRVPLAKVQSVRWTEGPAQRRLHLASIHLDTAGRSVYCVARDRASTEARDILIRLPDMCRDARADPVSRR